MMRAGRLRTRVEVQRIADHERDKHGGIKPSWTTIALRWASVVPLNGREYWSAQQVQSDVTHGVEMRFFEGLTSKHRLRLLHSQRVLNIKSVIDVEERHREMQLMCVEVVPQPAEVA